MNQIFTTLTQAAEAFGVHEELLKRFCFAYGVKSYCFNDVDNDPIAQEFVRRGIKMEEAYDLEELENCWNKHKTDLICEKFPNRKDFIEY